MSYANDLPNSNLYLSLHLIYVGLQPRMRVGPYKPTSPQNKNSLLLNCFMSANTVYGKVCIHVPRQSLNVTSVSVWMSKRYRAGRHGRYEVGLPLHDLALCHQISKPLGARFKSRGLMGHRGCVKLAPGSPVPLKNFYMESLSAISVHLTCEVLCIYNLENSIWSLKITTLGLIDKNRQEASCKLVAFAKILFDNIWVTCAGKKKRLFASLVSKLTTVSLKYKLPFDLAALGKVIRIRWYTGAVRWILCSKPSSLSRTLYAKTRHYKNFNILNLLGLVTLGLIRTKGVGYFKLYGRSSPMGRTILSCHPGLHNRRDGRWIEKTRLTSYLASAGFADGGGKAAVQPFGGKKSQPEAGSEAETPRLTRFHVACRLKIKYRRYNRENLCMIINVS